MRASRGALALKLLFWLTLRRGNQNVLSDCRVRDTVVFWLPFCGALIQSIDR